MKARTRNQDSRLKSINHEIEEATRDKRSRGEMDRLSAELVLAREMSDLIESRKVSVREVARKMKTSPSQLHRVLNFEISTSLSTVWRFAEALDCELVVKFRPRNEVQQPVARDSLSERIEKLEGIIGVLSSKIENLAASFATLKHFWGPAYSIEAGKATMILGESSRGFRASEAEVDSDWPQYVS